MLLFSWAWLNSHVIHANHLDKYSDMFIKFLTCFDVKVTFGYLWIPLVVSCCFIGFLFPQKIPLIFQARHPMASLSTKTPSHRLPGPASARESPRSRRSGAGDSPEASWPIGRCPRLALGRAGCRAGCRSGCRAGCHGVPWGMGDERNKMDGFRSPAKNWDVMGIYSGDVIVSWRRDRCWDRHLAMVDIQILQNCNTHDFNLQWPGNQSQPYILCALT